MVQDELPHGGIRGKPGLHVERRFGMTAVVDAFGEEMFTRHEVLFKIHRCLFEVHHRITIVRRATPKNDRGHAMFRIAKRFDEGSARATRKRDDRGQVITAESCKLTRKQGSRADSRAADAFFVDVELRRDTRQHVVEKHEFFVHARLRLRHFERPLEKRAALRFRNDRYESLRIGCELNLAAIVEVIRTSAKPMPKENDRKTFVRLKIGW